VRKWKRLHEGVARSIQEAGDELLTFMRFPKAQWKAIRTTNIIERLNQEFRRRVKTQGMFPTESSILILLFGVVASGMVKLRKIEGFDTMEAKPKISEHADQALAIA
jgi:transposase-like protein